VVDADAGEEDVLVYLGKRDKAAWARPRKQGKYEMADTHWQGKSLKALAARTAEAVIEELPVGGITATTDRTIEFWLRSFFGDLVDLHADKIRRTVVLARNLLGDDVRGDGDDADERNMKVRLLDKFEKAFQDSARCICSGPFAIYPRSDDLSETSATSAEFVVDDMGNIDAVLQAAAATTTMVLSVEQRRLSTKLLSGMSDGVFDPGALRILLNMAENGRTPWMQLGLRRHRHRWLNLRQQHRRSRSVAFAYHLQPYSPARLPGRLDRRGSATTIVWIPRGDHRTSLIL
jgi:hypothetical protein